MLYKRADHTNPKWTVRIKVPTIKGFVVRSTKTTDDFEARRFAEHLYYQLEGKAVRGEPINTPTFRKVFAEWSKVPVVEQVVRSARYVNGNVRQIEIWALPYFADATIDKVTEDKLANYVDWRLSQPRRPAIVTLKNERTAIRQLLKFAKRRGYISEVPDFHIKSGRPNARPDIPEVEWHRLTRHLPVYVDRAQGKRRQRERYYVALYILIMGNTGLRIGEARRLKWRDVSTTRTLTDEVRAILTVRGKTGEREVVCNKGVERLLDELQSYRTQEVGNPPSDQEFVFCHPSGDPVRVVQERFPDGPKGGRGPIRLRREKTGPLFPPAHLRDHEACRGGQCISAGSKHGDVGRDAGGLLRQETDARPEDGHRDHQEPETGKGDR